MLLIQVRLRGIKSNQAEKKHSFYNKVKCHQLKPVALPEAVQFDSILFSFHGGACEGGSKSIKFRWDSKDLSFHEDIANTSMTLNRWYEIKRNLKLWKNDAEQPFC